MIFSNANKFYRKNSTKSIMICLWKDLRKRLDRRKIKRIGIMIRTSIREWLGKHKELRPSIVLISKVLLKFSLVWENLIKTIILATWLIPLMILITPNLWKKFKALMTKRPLWKAYLTKRQIHSILSKAKIPTATN